MKNTKKIFSMLIILVMILGNAMAVNAQVTDIVTKDRDTGEYYTYSYEDIMKSAGAADIIGTDTPEAQLYNKYHNQKVVAIKDSTNGYIDFDEVTKVAGEADILGERFNLNEYTSSDKVVPYTISANEIKHVIAKEDGSLEEKEIDSDNGTDNGSDNDTDNGTGEPEIISVVSVIPTSNTTVEVTFNKSVEKSDYDKEKFKFEPNLVVESATNSGTKVKLTTSEQSSEKTYTFTYNGTSTGKSFKGLALNAPEAPDIKVDISNGEIIGLDNTMEYSTDGINWTDCTGSLPDTLEGKTIHIRVKKTDSDPVGISIEIKVPEGEIDSTPGTYIKDATFIKGTFEGEIYYGVLVNAAHDVFVVRIDGINMVYQGNDQFSMVSPDWTEGQTVTIKAYNYQNKVLEEKKYIVIEN